MSRNFQHCLEDCTTSDPLLPELVNQDPSLLCKVLIGDFFICAFFRERKVRT